MPTADTKPPDLVAVAEYARSFEGIFSRVEHLRWFARYLWGLMATPGRKSIEAISRVLPADSLPAGASASQALQHFLSRSPWDSRQLLAKLRQRFPHYGEPGSRWVVHEAICLKRGRHSVGVHRQFLRDQGIKANCQSAVLISQVGPSGYLPLNLRLYLPRGWLERARPTQLAEIPVDDRQPIGKDAIAQNLLSELLAEEKKPTAIVVTNGFAASPSLSEFITAAGCVRSEDAADIIAADAGRDGLKGNLGLDHFEGRSWRGWHHHAASVLAAYGYLELNRDKRHS